MIFDIILICQQLQRIILYNRNKKFTVLILHIRFKNYNQLKLQVINYKIHMTIKNIKKIILMKIFHIIFNRNQNIDIKNIKLIINFLIKIQIYLSFILIMLKNIMMDILINLILLINFNIIIRGIFMIPIKELDSHIQILITIHLK